MVQIQVVLGKLCSLDEYQVLFSFNIEEYECFLCMMESMLFLVCVDNVYVVLQIQLLDVVEEFNCIVDYFEGIVEEVQVCIVVVGSGILYVDVILLCCVVGNLVVNVICYILLQGVISLEVIVVVGVILIGVVNFGVGILLDQIECIFDCFYCVDFLCSSVSGFSGLGLVIVWIIMVLYGG